MTNKTIKDLLPALSGKTLYIKLGGRLFSWDVASRVTDFVLNYSTPDDDITIQLDSEENADRPAKVAGNNCLFFAEDTEGEHWYLSTSIDFLMV